jgi:hypothetical protein
MGMQFTIRSRFSTPWFHKVANKFNQTQVSYVNK